MKRFPCIFIGLFMMIGLAACTTATKTEVAPLPTVTQTAVPTSTPIQTAVPTSTAVPLVSEPENPFLAMDAASLSTAFLTAAHSDDLAAITQIIVAGVDIDVHDKRGNNALMIATARGYADIVQVLLDNGADAMVIDPGGNNLLHLAVNSGNLETVQMLTAQGIDVNARGSFYGSSPLILAAKGGYVEIGQFLLANGADMNQGDDWLDPALNIAAYNGQLAFIQMLLDNGATPTVFNTLGRSGLDHALKQGHEEVAALLQAAGALKSMTAAEATTLLFTAAKENNMEHLMIAVAQGADLEAKEPQAGLTPLTIAAINGYTDMVAYLISMGANVNAATLHDMTPLMWAAQKGFADLVSMLIEAGATIDQLSDATYKQNALHFAAEAGHANVVAILLDAGADINGREGTNSTALMYAAYFNEDTGVVTLLIERGAALNLRDEGGKTALYWAKQRNHPGNAVLIAAAGGIE